MNIHLQIKRLISNDELKKINPKTPDGLQAIEIQTVPAAKIREILPDESKPLFDSIVATIKAHDFSEQEAQYIAGRTIIESVWEILRERKKEKEEQERQKSYGG